MVRRAGTGILMKMAYKAVAIGSVLGLTWGLMGGGTAVASEPAKLSQPQLKRLVLALPAITAATRTGYPAQSSGVACTVSAEVKANICYQNALHSDNAMAAGAAWATRLNILSFGSAAEARKYVAKAGAARPQALSASKTLVVAFDPTSVISMGSRMQQGPEASAFQAVGANAVWAACTDPSTNTSIADLASCAKSLAAAQAKRLP